jgi:flagellar motor switch protein FliG
MTTLAKLESMKDEEIQNWLRKVNPITLAIALLGANDKVKECIFRNMSQRASTLLRADIDSYREMDAKQLLIHMNASILEALI